jgi:hypothetical protein
MTITHGHAVKVKYLGPTNHKPSRIQFSWEGWPSDNSKTIRKTISRDYESSNKDYMRKGADLFRQWLETGPMGDRYTCEIVSVFSGSLGSDSDIMLINTTWKESV